MTVKSIKSNIQSFQDQLKQVQSNPKQISQITAKVDAYFKTVQIDLFTHATQAELRFLMGELRERCAVLESSKPQLEHGFSILKIISIFFKYIFSHLPNFSLFQTSTKTRNPNEPVGLINTGSSNACFINALRQFAYNTPLAKHLIEKLGGVILEDLSSYQKFQGEGSMGGSQKIRDSIGFSGNSQEDAHEALSRLFSGIEGGRFGEKPPIHPDHVKNGTQNPLFNWTKTTRFYDAKGLPQIDMDSMDSLEFINNGLRHTGYDFNAVLTLSVVDEKGEKLTAMSEIWDNFSHPTLSESIQDRQDFSVPTRDDEKVLLEKVKHQVQFLEAPQHLIWSLKRYNSSTEAHDPIDVQPTFSLDERHLEKGGTVTYEIQAFITHLGIMGKGGHYIAHVRIQDKWYRCDDSYISTVTDEQVKKEMKKAYIFYANKTAEFAPSSKPLHQPALPSEKKDSTKSITKQSKTVDENILKERLGNINLKVTYFESSQQFAQADINELLDELESYVEIASLKKYKDRLIDRLRALSSH